MTVIQRNRMDDLDYILVELLKEQQQSDNIAIPQNIEEKRSLMRSLLNVRQPLPVSRKLLKAQDAELGRQIIEKGIVRAEQIQGSSLDPRLKLWQGDITRLKVAAIVNAANNRMLGCFVPLHDCIDNAIHSAAGIQLRLECQEIMKAQGHPEPTGSAKITQGYNLPAEYVIHTVGPVIGSGIVSYQDESQLADCYQSCLNIARENQLKSIAFCCISTGEYCFPNQRAAEIAVDTVRDFFYCNGDTVIETVFFNVFKDLDFSIYSNLLQPE